MQTIRDEIRRKYRNARRFEYASLAIIILSIGLLYGMVLGGLASSDGPAPAPTAALERQASVAGPLSGPLPVFKPIDFRLGDAGRDESRASLKFADKMPAGIALAPTATERKQVFIKLMIPMVLRANENILIERRRLLDLSARVGALEPHERDWLDGMARRYGLDTPDFGQLLVRVDVVPPSLALAQAAEESGWGTSRFVREGNAVFGQRSYRAGSGIVPKKRAANEVYEVRAFDRLYDSVASYMANLNSHYAYEDFRRRREVQRRDRGFLDGHALAGTLERYSERGPAYIRAIRSIIKANGLDAFDRAQIFDREAAVRSDSRV